MKNLILNVIRSFKRNKISILGLIFLLFFGFGVFVTMSNTTANIRNEYTSLAERGKLHDFTASELYDVGSVSYLPYTKGVSYYCDTDGYYKNWECFNFQDDEGTKHITTSTLFPGTSLGANKDTKYFVPIPEQETFGEYGYTQTVIRTYHIVLDKDSSTGLYKTFAEQHPNSEYVDFTFRTVHTYEPDPYLLIPTIPWKVLDYQDILNKWNRGQTLTENEIRELAGDPSITDDYSVSSLFSDDYQAFVKYLGEHTQNVFSIITTSDTPLANYIDTQYGDEVEQRFFKSINVTTTEDNIFYKIIDSNPTDNIDTMVLFADPVGRYGNRLFNTNDWKPYDSEITIYDLDEKEIEPGSKFDLPNGDTLTIPENFNEVANAPIYDPEVVVSWSGAEGKICKFIYSQILRIRFKRMLSSDCTSSQLKSLLDVLSAAKLDRYEYAVQLFSKGSLIYQAFSSYYNDWYGLGESITISSNGNVVFTWVELLGTIQTCTISNWTSHFSIVNPQHLEKSDKRVIDPSELNDFVPFREWHKAKYKRYPGGEISQFVAASWFNTLSQDQFGFWMNPNTKSSWATMSYIIDGLQDPVVIVRGNGPGQWNGIDKQYIADCGGYNQIIWGCGLTPDFMYPVVDITRPTPNTATECLVYCNDTGYQTVKLAFATSTIEEYLLARFKPNVNTNRRHAIVDDINNWAKQNMIFPDNVKSAYFADDTNNMLNCSGYRVSYIPNLVSVVQIVVTILSSFIGILCLVICFVIIKRYVENNRVSIGIMRANGIKKWKIGLSMLPFAFFPALIGGIAAYVTGLLLQAPALSLFKNYWMLPTPLIQFDWVSFLASIFLPFVVFGLICFFATLFVLRVSSVELMKSGSEFKTNSFSRIAKKPFKHFGILTRFRVALAFNSISRLFMLAAMSCLTMSSLVFAFTTFDKLNASRVTNSTQFDYNFNIKLTTPTANGSVYSVYDYSQPIADNYSVVRGFGWSNPEEYIFNTQWDTTNWSGTKPVWGTEEGKDFYKNLTKWYSVESMLLPLDIGYRDSFGNNGNLLIPNMTDSNGQIWDLMYLQYKMCSRLTLDYNIGIPGIATSNPWEIALALMPANSRNIAADSFNNIMNKVGHKVVEANNAFYADPEIKALPKTDVHGYPYATPDTVESVRQTINKVAEKVGKWFYVYEWNNGSALIDPTEYYWRNNFLDYFKYDSKTDIYSLDTNIETVGYLAGASFKSSFISLIRTIYTDKEMVEMEYPITYGSLPLNWDKKDEDKKDEPYTYITANISELSNHHGFDPSEEIDIEGIIKDSKYIKLTNSNDESINSWLFDQNYLNSLGINDGTYPLIANAYASHKYGLHIGDEIKVSVKNSVTRFDQKLRPQDFDKDVNDATFKVVGISKGTNNSAFYTTQKIGNDILGLPNGETWNKTHRYMMWSTAADWGNPTVQTLPQLIDLAGVGVAKDKTAVYKFSDGTKFVDKPIIDTSINKLQLPTPVGFNGIYTENRSGKPITSSLTLYSYIGLYPSTSVYKSNGNNKFAQILATRNNLAIANLMSGIQDPKYYEATAKYLSGQMELGKFEEIIQEFINKVAETFGDTTMVPAISGGMDVAATDLIYSNLISTFNLAETTIMAIIIPITIIIVAIISNLIIGDSKKMAAMLKALGYSDAKNLLSILALFVPTILIGLMLAVPLAFGLTIGYQSLIFTSANILIDVTQKWWYYIAAVGGIGLILIGTYGIGYASIKKARLVDEIK